MRSFTKSMMTLATIAMLASPALAAPADATSRHFNTTMISHLSDQAQRTGELTITIAADGSVNGTYRTVSGGPDIGKSLPVTGGVQSGAINITIGQSDYKVVGTLDDSGIVGTAYDAGRKQFDFIASNA